ncbi:DUF6339 family protein [[Mycobacterium] wendilense]|uniref:DUF6339 family protein n=1 Tax=[Mycobacterium] wendilense TaxID=3064284 RepID=A0ABM9MCJ4_9MYCO|nr:DUF6339 family protein [Mycolicibacterium sp. MU0050]CAJ1581891.1 DUF6339 family protein [Mycolicibacterium sp. MU0050]
MSDVLHTLPVRLDAVERLRHQTEQDGRTRPLSLPDDSSPSLEALDSLMNEVKTRTTDAVWADRTHSDRWVAPRVHYALRLLRSEAADRGVWQWLALRYSWYVEWRWSAADGTIADDRWWGPIHKQTFARLWWGAEIFRAGSDYRPVERAFKFQDLPNSYLHRPIVRCRSLAVAIVDRVTEAGEPSSDQVNDLARVLNLATVGTPPEVETDYQTDDIAAYDTWCRLDPSVPDDWTSLPTGPEAVDISETSLRGATGIVDRAWGYAGLEPSGANVRLE